MNNYERIFRVIGLLLLTLFLGVYFIKVNIFDLQVILTLGVGVAVVDTFEKLN